jgi:hypothetical protein
MNMKTFLTVKIYIIYVTIAEHQQQPDRASTTIIGMEQLSKT